MSSINFNNLTLKVSQRTLLQSINLTLHPGNYQLHGENGVGKSTLFKAICGLVKPEAGGIDVDGNIDLVADHVQIPPTMTPKAVFNIYDKYKRCDIEKRNLLVRRFSYQEQLDKSIGALSQGNLQKLKIILALSGNGSWLLLDEVFNGLDESAIDILNELLGESSRPMLVIDHSLAFSVPNIQNLLMADQHLCTAT